MILTLLAAISMYLLPVLTGRALLVGFGQKKSGWALLEYFVTGSLALYAFGFIFQKVGILTEFMLPTALVSVLAMVSMLNIFSVLVQSRSWGVFTERKQIWEWMRVAGFIAFLTLLVFGLWHWDTPLPYTLNWDIFEHQTVVNLMMKGNFSWVASQISDTFGFDGYSTMFHWVLTIPQVMFQVEPLEFWGVAEGVHLFLSISAVYVLALVVGKNRFFAAVAASIGAFSFESYVAYTSLFLVPQTVTALFFAFGLGYYLRFGMRRGKGWFYPVLFFFLVINHYIIGSAAVGILMGCMVLQWLISKWKSSYLVWAIAAPVGIYGAVQWGMRYMNVATINGGEAINYLYSLGKLTTFMQVFFGYAMVVLVPLGIVASIFPRQKRQRILVVMSAVVGAIVISGIPYALKFYVLGHYVVSVVAAAGVTLVIRPTFSSFTKAIALLLLVLWFSTHFILNAGYWKHDVHYAQLSTHVSQNEREAAAFLKDAYAGRNAMILSDPATQYVAEALSGINSPGGAYMSQVSRMLVGSMSEASSAAEFAHMVYGVVSDPLVGEPDMVVLLLSERMFQWLSSGSSRQRDVSFNIWAPAVLSPGAIEKVDAMIADFQLTPVYTNADMVIVEVPKKDL